jgi:hypothetical protein
MDRFNFYDVYGYLIPGLVTLGVLWLPFRIVLDVKLPSEWSATFVAIVVGYVVGHILQFLATPAFPHMLNGRFYSATFLDENDQKFSPEVKMRIAERIQREFGVDVRDAASENLAMRDRRRADAFMMCRRSLIQEKLASYAEQFQGLYALMRGLGAASVLGAAHQFGWVSALLFPGSEPFLICLAVAGMIVLALHPDAGAGFELVAVLAAIAGALFGAVHTASARMTSQNGFVLFVIALFLMFVARRTFASCYRFASLFAETVYRDFAARPAGTAP